MEAVVHASGGLGIVARSLVEPFEVLWPGERDDVVDVVSCPLDGVDLDGSLTVAHGVSYSCRVGLPGRIRLARIRFCSTAAPPSPLNPISGSSHHGVESWLA